MAQNKEYKITVSFDGIHVASIWCNRYAVNNDCITGYVNQNITFVMFHDYSESEFGGNRAWKITHRDEILASSDQMHDAIAPLEANGRRHE